MIAIGSFVGFVILRKVGLDDSGPLSALLLLGRDDRRVRRRHGPEGQERLVLDDLPAAAGAAHLRPDAVRARRQQPLPAVRRLRQELLRLQPARGLPGRPQRRRRLLERLPQVLRRRLPGPRSSASSRPPTTTSLGMLLYMAVSTALFALAIDLREGLRAHDHVARSARSRSASSTGRSPAARARHVADPRRRDRARRRLAAAHLAQGEAVPGPGRGARRRRRRPAAPRRARSPTTAR